MPPISPRDFVSSEEGISLPHPTHSWPSGLGNERHGYVPDLHSVHRFPQLAAESAVVRYVTCALNCLEVAWFVCLHRVTYVRPEITGRRNHAMISIIFMIIRSIKHSRTNLLRATFFPLFLLNFLINCFKNYSVK